MKEKDILLGWTQLTSLITRPESLPITMTLPLWIRLTTSWHVIKCQHIKLKDISWKFDDIWMVTLEVKMSWKIFQFNMVTFHDIWWYLVTFHDIYVDFSWQNMSFIMICHDRSWQIIKWLHLIQKGTLSEVVHVWNGAASEEIAYSTVAWGRICYGHAFMKTAQVIRLSVMLNQQRRSWAVTFTALVRKLLLRV